MDIFTIDDTNYTNGQIVNGIEDAIWVERYDTNGEFTFHVKPESVAREILAPDVMISHTDTKCVMMVETNEIDETKEDGPVMVEITGRTVDVIAMENRVVTTEYRPSHWLDTSVYVPVSGLADGAMIYHFPNSDSWNQVVTVIYDFLENSVEASAENLPNFHVESRYVGASEPSPPKRTADDFGLLSDVVYNILPSASAGLKVERPTPDHPTTLNFVVHNGTDMSATVIFDWEQGDVDNARYYWSTKNKKNAAYAKDQDHRIKIREGSETGWGLRILKYDLSDLNLTTGSTPSWFDASVARIRDKLNKLNDETIIDASVSKTARYEYGVDYNIGDKVFVQGNYGISSVMRVTEYARTMDATGESGFPTLSQI